MGTSTEILHKDTFYFTHHGIQHICPMCVWHGDEQDIRQYVRDYKLMLPGSDSPVVSNNLLMPTMFALDIKNLGYVGFEPEFAQLIREGKSSRSAWLHIFELTEYAATHGYMDAEVNKTLSKLDLIQKDVLC